MKKLSETALEVAAVKDQYVEYLEKRERIPQPTFWLAFASRIRSIKNKKEELRHIREMLES